jgi:hypothetical protein
VLFSSVSLYRLTICFETNLSQKNVKKTSTIIFATVLLAQLATPINVLADETQKIANTSQISTAIEQLSPQTVQEVLQEVCESRGYKEKCAKNLLGILWKESRNVADAVGDHGLALGYFQIHYKLHHVSVACATDLRCSANWTLDYLEQHSYPKYPTYAIQCHNTCAGDGKYAAAALYQGNRLWNQPLSVEGSATGTLAQN